MHAYDVLRQVHQIGSPLVGTVTGCTEIDLSYTSPGGHVTLETSSEYRTILPYQYLADNPSQFNSNLIPPIGSEIATVVFNFVDGTLYLSARPFDLKPSTIKQSRDFYAYVQTLEVGSEVVGVVEKVASFGLFVNIGSQYIGLIDIGHTAINGGQALPFDCNAWPTVGDKIRCSIGYIRFRNRQIGLGWLPAMDKAR